MARAVCARRRVRVALVCALIASPALAAGWLWLRDSPLVSVQRVQISGVSGPDAAGIEAALTGAAHRMSTLDVNAAALRAAVAPFHVVSALRVQSSFPHGLHIAVKERVAVATLLAGGLRTALAADGTVLGPALASGSLPTLTGSYVPAIGASVREGGLLATLTVIGAAPAPLGRLIASASDGPRGVMLTLHGGLQAYFGDMSRPHAKWLSLARVLADSSSAGAAYVDVRLPERPAAGFAPGAGPPVPERGSAGAAGAPSGEAAPATHEAAIAALAAALGNGNESAAGSPAGTGTAGGGAPSGGQASGTEVGGGGSESASGGAEAAKASEASSGEGEQG